MHTSAEPLALSGQAILLRLDGEELLVKIQTPAAARLAITFPPAPRSFEVVNQAMLHGEALRRFVSERPRVDADGRTIRRLEIRWPRRTRRLTVVLSPTGCEATADIRVTPLADWLARRPLCGPGRRKERSTNWSVTRARQTPRRAACLGSEGVTNA
jgi:hypothetical protein